MNRLDTIRATVAAHFAAFDEMFTPPDHTQDNAYAKALAKRLDNEHAAMCLLRDLLPLLNAVVKIESNDGKLPEFTWYSMLHDYEIEAAKLLEEVES